jgi:hydroxyquinol 1,2-dioxygenase
MATRDLDEQSITTAVIERFAEVPDPRLKRILCSLVKHTHDFVRDVELTEAEWFAAIDFLTRTGQACTGTRQEFILLSDTLGVSMLVDAINHRQPAGATETTVLGPFYVNDPPVLPNGADIAEGHVGTPLWVSGTVTTPGGTPLSGAHVDVWHSDEDGFYDVQKPDAVTAQRARFVTAADGSFGFWTLVPCFYPVPHDGPVGAMLKASQRHPYRPAHIHFMIANPRFDTLVTHLFIAGDPYLDSDAVFGVKRSLIVELAEGTGPAPGRPALTQWKTLSYRFGLKPAGDDA